MYQFFKINLVDVTPETDLREVVITCANQVFNTQKFVPTWWAMALRQEDLVAIVVGCNHPESGADFEVNATEIMSQNGFEVELERAQDE